MSVVPSPPGAACPQCGASCPAVACGAAVPWFSCERCALVWRAAPHAGPVARGHADLAPSRGWQAGYEAGGVRRRLGLPVAAPPGPVARLGWACGRLLGHGGGLARQLGHVRAAAGASVLVVGPAAARRAAALGALGLEAATAGPRDPGLPARPHHEVPLERLHDLGARFDVVLLDRVLADAEDPRRVVEGARRALATGGELVVLVPRLEGPIGAAADRLEAAGARRAWTIPGLRGVLRASRLEVVVARHLPAGEALMRARARA